MCLNVIPRCISLSFNYTEKGFACPCGKCTLKKFLDGKCPEKRSDFPCLNKSTMPIKE